MVKIVLVAFVALAFVQASLAKPAKEKASDRDVVQELTAQAETLVNNVTTTLGIKVPTTDEVVNALNNSTKQLADMTTNMVNKLKSEVKAHSPEINEMVANAENKLKEIQTNLKTAVGPEATKKAEDLSKTVKDSMNSIFAELEKFAKTLEPQVKGAQDDVAKWTKQSMDQLVKVSKDIETNVKTSLADHDKTHKA